MSEIRLKVMGRSEHGVTLMRPDGKPLGDDIDFAEGGVVFVMSDDDSDENDEEVTEFERRLRKAARWATRARGLMSDAAANVNLAAVDVIGPEARKTLLDHTNGDKQAAAAALYTAREKIADVEKAAKGARDSGKAVGETAEHLLWAIDRHHVDLLSGQTSIDEVQEGRHRESTPPPEGDGGTPKKPGRRGRRS